MASRPGTPRLLRELNDRAALELLIDAGPLTRAQIGEHTGLSKVTASQLLSRLEERGLVEVVGEQAGGRGPNAALYAVVPSSAYVAGLEVGRRDVTAGIADITGNVISQATISFDGASDPVAVVHAAVVKACRTAKVALPRLSSFVIGTPGVVDPRSGDVQFVFDLPAWHEGVLEGLRADLRRPVVLENDVNLVAVAERAFGAAREAEDFALMWLDRGIGMAVMLGGRLHRGLSGGAGEIGYLPVPGVPLPEGVTESITWGQPALAGGFASLISTDAILELARSFGRPEGTAEECVRGAAEEAAADQSADGQDPEGQGSDGRHGFLDELAKRISYGVAAVNIVLDPGLVVLSGELGRAGGNPLATRVERAVARICPTRPRIVLTQIDGNPVLRGALHSALQHAREEVFSSTTN